MTGVFAWLRWASSRDQVDRRYLRGAVQVAISEVRDGRLVKVVGTVAYEGEPVTSPLTGKVCAYYEAHVDQHVTRDRGAVQRVQRAHQCGGGNFWVVDATGRALVRIEDARLLVGRDAHITHGALDTGKESVRAFLKRWAIESDGPIASALHFSEGVLEAGEEVVVCGRARWERDPDPRHQGGGYRDSQDRLVLEAPAGDKLVASDDPALINPA